MAPDLTSVTRRRSDGWIRDQIRNSKKHNPDSRMPSFDYLSGRQINAIIRYLKS
jgi:cbb3-type cytochrome oxidase cytochrome c subunit